MNQRNHTLSSAPDAYQNETFLSTDSLQEPKRLPSIDRRRFLQVGGAGLLGLLWGCQYPSCPISWNPSALAPVFFGIRDYGPDQGAPGHCRVYYPSIDGAVMDAPILQGCNRYPLILFAHGHCADDPVTPPPDQPDSNEGPIVYPYMRWHELAGQLARAGYVVVVPEMPGIGTHPSTPSHPSLNRMAEIAAWMREDWGYRHVILPPPNTGVVGHSFGAMVGARFTATQHVSAYASIAGVWEDWPSGPRPIEDIGIPMFFCWGTDDLFTNLSSTLWNSLAQPRYKVTFTGARHWDYLPAGASDCENGRGPCAITRLLAMDLITLFFGKYLPPEYAGALRGKIPPSLIPPPIQLTTEQQYYASHYLRGLSEIDSSPGCQMNIAYVTPHGSGFIQEP